MTDFKRADLLAFTRTTEKDPPPILIGREAILARQMEAVEVAWRGEAAPEHGAPGQTQILHGAPGAGKSSILAELRKRSKEAGVGLGVFRVVELAPHDLQTDLAGAVRTVAAAGGMPPDRWQALTAHLTGSVSIGIADLRAALGWTDRTDPQNLNELKAVFPPQRWQVPVIVAIDEAQRFAGDHTTPHAMFLQAIHDGKLGLPLVLTMAGLGDTRERTRAMHLTRGSTTHAIGALTTDDATTLMGAVCTHFGMDPEPIMTELVCLAAPCEGWPHHLHGTLRTLGRAALETGGDLCLIDWAAVHRDAADSRLQSYRDQQSALMDEAATLTAMVVSTAHPRDGASRSEVLEVIHQTARTRKGTRLPRGTEPEHFIEHLVHCGALHMGPDKRLRVPIPSFRNYLLEAGGLGTDGDLTGSSIPTS